jgi:secreted PhoX family phosphatase
MNDTLRSDLPHCGDDDLDTNSSGNDAFDAILAAHLSRRSLLKGSFGLASSAFFAGSLAACSSTGARDKTLKLTFDAVAKSRADVVSVPAGYTATALLRLGDPIAAGVAEYRNDGTDPGASCAQRAGDHHDGMHYFGMGADGRWSPDASDRGLLVINHEAITPAFLHVSGQTIVNGVRTINDEVVKELNVHGVSVVEVNRAGNTFTYKRAAPLNRRITTITEMTLAGPAARSPSMVTRFSPDGSRTRGTVNNCAHGHTPWGTYLTCEENWAGYFRRIPSVDNANRSARELASFSRYGVSGVGRELWATAIPADPADTLFQRWDATRTGTSADGSDDFRNAPNTYGWVVEIDPFAPNSIPRKRTALGRFAHEGAWPAPVVAGRPLVWYMGDDSRNEYIYKYVSSAGWDPADATRGIAAGDKYLDDGRLYVAKFGADGTGTWLELRFGTNGIVATNAAYAFENQVDVLVNTRFAADAAGATKMDRPEWGAVNPVNGEAYVTLTNNSAALRTLASADAANPRFYNDPKNGAAQRGNPNGHIVRWSESNADPAATGFRWDVFLFGARSSADPVNVNVSGLTASNDFSSPDGLWFARSGLLWIETDDGAYTDVTNCMLLAAIPGRVGDGGRRTINNVDGTATRAVDTFVGAPLGEANLRRFLVGPVDCEITGVAETPDGKALFVNIQHPGEETPVANISNPTTFNSHWPDGGNARPRSTTIVITRNDGGEVGGVLD